MSAPEQASAADQSSLGEQTWQRCVPGTDVPIVRITLHVDDQGRARVHEAILTQLLASAGWERSR